MVGRWDRNSKMRQSIYVGGCMHKMRRAGLRKVEKRINCINSRGEGNVKRRKVKRRRKPFLFLKGLIFFRGVMGYCDANA